jgi:hypothetical protein
MCPLQGVARASKLEYLESNEGFSPRRGRSDTENFASDCKPGNIAEPFAGWDQSKGVGKQRDPLTRGVAVKVTEPAQDAVGRLLEQMG